MEESYKNAVLTSDQQKVIDSLKKGNNIFITGGGGVGKSFILRHIINKYSKSLNIGITSTTGISALNINGITIHSWAGIGLGQLDVRKLFSKVKRNSISTKRWRETDLLILDEISMIDPDLLDKLNTLGKIMRSSSEPFGGIQLIFGGDLLQLSCISNNKFCFESKCWESLNLDVIYLIENIRQEDEIFQRCLNLVRVGIINDFVKNTLKPCIKRKLKPLFGIKPTRLYSHNRDIDYINNKKFNRHVNTLEIPEIFEYNMEIIFKNINESKYKEKYIKNNPAVQNLELCIGCQVVLIFNIDHVNGLVNGSRGIVTNFVNDIPIVKFMNGIEIPITFNTWKLEKMGKEIGSISQIPLRLAYAISIHKSQGMTLDYVTMDLSKIFDYGMGYVALSRAKSLENLSISSINWSRIIAHPIALDFYKK
jgi:ATP-dependent DNA helicase PIF1